MIGFIPKVALWSNSCLRARHIMSLRAKGTARCQSFAHCLVLAAAHRDENAQESPEEQIERGEVEEVVDQTVQEEGKQGGDDA